MDKEIRKIFSWRIGDNLVLKRANARNRQDVPAWLSLILAGRPWPASEVSAANHRRGDSFGGQSRCEPSPNILPSLA